MALRKESRSIGASKTNNVSSVPVWLNPYAVYRFFAPDYLEDFEDDFDDEMDEDFFDEDENEFEDDADSE